MLDRARPADECEFAPALSSLQRTSGAATGDVLFRLRPDSRRDAADIAIEVAAGPRLDELADEWRDLLARADAANVFMDPRLVRLVEQSYPGARCRVVLAWNCLPVPRRLVGVWSFVVARAPRSILPTAVLRAPAMSQGFLATPVIDGEFIDDVLAAMLKRIEADQRLPKILALEAADAGGATMQALNRLVEARRGARRIFAQSLRPQLVRTPGPQQPPIELSAGSLKKLRQHRRRLAKQGPLDYRIAAEPDAVKAFEDFLRLEASGWKGRRGTALLNNAGDAAFARAMVAALAASGDASIHGLYADGRPVSLQVVLRAGTSAFTWKTAYDEDLQDFSPGMLLFQDCTENFLADSGIAMVDSCAVDDSGFMAAWAGRRPVADLWIDCRCGGSLAFKTLANLQGSYLKLRAAAKSGYAVWHRQRSRWRRSMRKDGGARPDQSACAAQGQ